MANVRLHCDCGLLANVFVLLHTVTVTVTVIVTASSMYYDVFGNSEETDRSNIELLCLLHGSILIITNAHTQKFILLITNAYMQSLTRLKINAYITNLASRRKTCP